MAPYLKKAKGDKGNALSLYEWSTRTAAAAFEDIGHFEVLLRNALDAHLREHHREDACGIPWFLLPTEGGEHVANAVQVVRDRLRKEGRESRDQIIAGLSFGFWSGLLGPRYEELWRQCLWKAFPGSSGSRKNVMVGLEGVRKFRNRLAHHDSLLNVDVLFEGRRIVEMAGCIDQDVAVWLKGRSRLEDLYDERPHTGEDTVVVPAKEAWPLYEQCHAYVCQAGRTFRTVDRIAFYAGGEIKADVPKIVHRADQVTWDEATRRRLAASTDRNDKKIARVIAASRAAGWSEGRYQVFLLTRPGVKEHRALAVPLPHLEKGRGSAFTQRQRYTSLHSLEVAETTADL